jgi:hypothetical protein
MTVTKQDNLCAGVKSIVLALKSKNWLLHCKLSLWHINKPFQEINVLLCSLLIKIKSVLETNKADENQLMPLLG